MVGIIPVRHQLAAEEELRRTLAYFNKEKSAAKCIQTPIQKFVFEATLARIPTTEFKRLAVDLGCHWGRYTLILSNIYKRVIGIDIAEKAMLNAEKRDNIEYKILDLDKEPDKLIQFRNVDLFIAVAIFEMLENPVNLLLAIKVNMCLQGKIFIVIPNPYSVNYMFLKLAFKLSRLFGRKDRYIFHNGMNKSKLIECIELAGLKVIRNGSFVGLPVYALDKMPSLVQRLFIALEGTIGYFLGGSYFWVVAGKDD